MKDLFKPKKAVSDSSASDKHPVSSSNDVQQFLSKVATIPKTAGDGRLIFALDATASRQSTWDVASQLQGEMFSSTQSLGGLNIQLCYFRGFAEFYNSSWQSSGNELLKKMSGIFCQAGATQLERVLRHALAENDHQKISCVVFIGDAMEENIDILAQLAGKLGLLNIPLFMFQERNDPSVRQAYVEMARLSGGAYSQFDSASAGQLKELLKAVAVFAAGGYQALQNFSKTSNEAVKLLERQLK
jgi:hypothetical protein